MNKQILREEDLIKGIVYYYEAHHGIKWIYKYKETSLCLNGKYLSPKVVLARTGLIELRPATEEEKRHLRACIVAGKYMECPKEEIINLYQIY